jgi:hypothetical protein
MFLRPGAKWPRPSSEEWKTKSIEGLAMMMEKKGLEPWKRQEIMKKLMQRLHVMLKNDGDQMTPEEKKRIEDLLKDVKKGGGPNGTEDGSLIANMLEALGFPGDIAQAVGERLSDATLKATVISESGRKKP